MYPCFLTFTRRINLFLEIPEIENLDKHRFEPGLWDRLVAANLAPADMPAEEFAELDQEITTSEVL